MMILPVVAVAVGLACSGNPTQAATIAHFDAQITNAEDGVYGASNGCCCRLVGGGHHIDEALLVAAHLFPGRQLDRAEDQIAQQCRQEATVPQDLPLLLTTRLINSVYSYGNAAPETVPAALALVDACQGDLQQAVLWANTIPKAADSLPALVGALCGAHQGAAVISPRWQAQLNRCRGLCLPFVAGVQLDQIAQALSLL
ncbi:MAG: ADP-ribosylglycohydrolase family protein [Caldilineaceae bacterium]